MRAAEEAATAQLPAAEEEEGERPTIPSAERPGYGATGGMYGGQAGKAASEGGRPPGMGYGAVWKGRHGNGPPRRG